MRKIFFLALLSAFLALPAWAGFMTRGPDLVNKAVSTSQPYVSQMYNAIFTSNGTFVVPYGVFEVFVDMVGGGGACAGDGDGVGCGGGGQAGDYCLNYRVPVKYGESYPVVIGYRGVSKTHSSGTNATYSSFGTLRVEGGCNGYWNGTGGGPAGGTGKAAQGLPGGPSEKYSGSFIAYNLLVTGASGGGGGEGIQPKGGPGGADIIGGNSTTLTSNYGGGGVGLFGRDAHGTGAGRGDAGTLDGYDGQCVIRWYK